MTLYPNEYVSLEQPHNNYWNHKQKVQWMLMLFSGCLYLYAARMAMPITVTVISGQTGWNKTTAGVVLCCFFWGYALTQVLGGYLGDLWGGAKVVLGSALGWSLLTLYTPEATRWNLATLLVARILLGAFQGLHFPAMSSIIVNHLRPQERTFFTSVVAAGPSCGLLFIGSVGSMAMVSHGWPVVFKLTGMLGIGWCFGLAYLMHRHGSKPGKASKVAPKVASAPAFRVPWIAYFRSPSFWVILLAHFTENNSYFILISWLPTYFHERFPEAQHSVPPLHQVTSREPACLKLADPGRVVPSSPYDLRFGPWNGQCVLHLPILGSVPALKVERRGSGFLERLASLRKKFSTVPYP